jgi:hypothetical protein
MTTDVVPWGKIATVAIGITDRDLERERDLLVLGSLAAEETLMGGSCRQRARSASPGSGSARGETTEAETRHNGDCRRVGAGGGIPILILVLGFPAAHYHRPK